MSGPLLPSPSELSADPRVAALLSRCTFGDDGPAIVCGVSGGPDSTALLALAAATGAPVIAVYVDHGLRPTSAGDAAVVEESARRLGASFRSERVEVGNGPNLEARARTARRAVLGTDAATGHTADDQAETVLVNLLRGAGVAGLAGMRAGPTHPILALRRRETEGLCRHLGLPTLYDPSNDDPRFVRNRIRHELIPLCSAIAGRDVVLVLARQAGVLAGDADLLDELALLIDPGDAAALSAAPEAAGRRAVRRWLAGAGGYPPPLDGVDRVLEVARADRRATELPGGRRVSRSRGRLTVTPPPSGPVPTGDGGSPVQSPP